ncbi:MAG TPA: IclR family transcriptional regulator [Geminicoccus sp.]|jgi:DNA-binding IclR family transcriptional regulator|uniref:IclR family transcriptional regulator n=1 Tax=Geminicoccus sp. TaxID=2024832 RepID=UPI002E33C23F|nr:IclR family transcriptional regulator [Geminicoccus sp.]HEX2527363.1 IclR family transcriptional regulator [Geminicoccus sp.]
MSDEGPADQKARNGVPVLERTLDILDILEKRAAGAGIRDLVQQLDLPRSTVYRILNTLAEREIVRRMADGSYQLGPRLLALAAQVRIDVKRYDLVALAQRHLHALAEATGEANKISVHDGDRVLTIAVAAATSPYGLAPAVGQRFPLHAGAASKMVMAHLEPAELEQLLVRPLEGYTARTVTDPAKLRSELARIRRQGWAQDRGEHGASVHALAAPIVEPDGRFVAALSVPFLSDKDPAARKALLRAVMETAAAISAEIPAS